MNNHEKQQSPGDREIDDQQKSSDDSLTASPSTDAVSSYSSDGNGIRLGDRLTNLFVGDGENGDDLLIQRGTQGTVMQWLQALDMQVMGACRADERLKPLLKLNVSVKTVYLLSFHDFIIYCYIGTVMDEWEEPCDDLHLEPHSQKNCSKSVNSTSDAVGVEEVTQDEFRSPRLCKSSCDDRLALEDHLSEGCGSIS